MAGLGLPCCPHCGSTFLIAPHPCDYRRLWRCEACVATWMAPEPKEGGPVSTGERAPAAPGCSLPGTKVRTRPDVRPARYADRRGTVTEAREVAPGAWEIAVRVGGKTSWFARHELVPTRKEEE